MDIHTRIWRCIHQHIKAIYLWFMFALSLFQILYEPSPHFLSASDIKLAACLHLFPPLFVLSNMPTNQQIAPRKKICEMCWQCHTPFRSSKEDKSQGKSLPVPETTKHFQLCIHQHWSNMGETATVSRASVSALKLWGFPLVPQRCSSARHNVVNRK